MHSGAKGGGAVASFGRRLMAFPSGRHSDAKRTHIG
jgi:hypothetical protein